MKWSVHGGGVWAVAAAAVASTIRSRTVRVRLNMGVSPFRSCPGRRHGVAPGLPNPAPASISGLFQGVLERSRNGQSGGEKEVAVMKHRFGELVLDLEAGRLLGPGGEIRLRPQAFKLLVVLVENAPRLLSQEELLDRVWGVEHLSPASVKQAVSEVRQALGDDPARPAVIETVSRRGYRFIAPLIRIEEEGAATRKPRPSLRSLAGIQLRTADRRSTASMNQPPPFNTRRSSRGSFIE